VLRQTFGEVIGVPNVVGTIAALQHVHEKWFHSGFALRQAQGERGIMERQT
jgi:hypothetical protein